MQKPGALTLTLVAALWITNMAEGRRAAAHEIAAPPDPPASATSPAASGPDGPPRPTPEQSSDAQLEEVVVTGTSIRGVAPIGSNVVTVGQKEIEATGAVTVSQLMNTVPAITTANSAPQGENVYSYYSPQIHSLGGSASNSTLVIMDGLRLPGGGTQYSETDPNIIPASALERVEVLADGASSVYGSDAVAGVVNFITRRNYEGLQLNLQAGKADEYHDYTADILWGTRWQSGSVMMAAQYTHQSRLDNIDRGFLSMGDYRPIGGSNMNSYNCSPATIKVPGSSSVYLSPSATTPVANTADNSPCNVNLWGSALPAAQRGNFLVKISNEFSDRLNTTTTVIANILKTTKPGTPGGTPGGTPNSVTNVTVYGPGSGKTGQINPFFVAPAGNPTATSEQISWLDLLTGNYGTNNSEEDVVYGTFVANYSLTSTWQLTFADAVAWDQSSLTSNNVFCAACANLALNGTTQVTGSTTASDISNQNVISLNTPLTPANALDVWHGPGANLTSPSVYNSLYSYNTSNTNLNTFNQAKLSAEGPLFALPAGDVRMAVGGEFMTAHLTQTLIGADNTGPTYSGSTQRIYHFGRNVDSTYLEFSIPVLASGNGIPLARAVDLDIAGRYDKYSDVGSTSNPKFAINWTVVEGVKLRANYSRSFVAPPLAVIGDPTQGYLYASGSAGLQTTTLFVPVANYPEVRGLPGCANATTTCAVGLSNNQGLRRQLGGGFDGIKPETGKGWSVGLDFTPSFLPGLAANVTLFNNDFRGGVTSPNPNSIVNSAGLHQRLTLCPSGCTPQQIAAFANTANGVILATPIPSAVYFLLDQNSGNVLNLQIQGLDMELSYEYPTRRWGTFRLADALTYFLRFDQDFGGKTFSVLNTSGYNTTFPSIQTQDRLNLGWTMGPVSVDAFANFTGSYRNWSNTSVNPVITDASGNPIGGGDRVASNLTIDLHAAYNFRAGPFKDAQVYLDGKNVLNRNPPFYNGNTAGILGGSPGFNGFVSNPIGRILSAGVRVNL
jgi:iron complex outermembrane receptor protein